MAKNNLFIAFEGIDGSGKSTQIKILEDKLKSQGHKVYSTCEPTNSPIGSIIRNIFNHRIKADHKTIAGLFVADRLDHLLNETNGIIKKLDEGYTVLTDRYYFSSYAYHSVHMDMEWVIQANSMSADLLRPDVNIYIDISPDISIERLTKGRSSIELYETKDNLTKVYEKYHTAFEKLKDIEHIAIIDGHRQVDMISSDIWDIVCKQIELP